MSREYPSDWDARRKEVYQRDNYTCQNCGRIGGPNGDTELHAHHVVPKSKGGSHRVENLQTLCKECHDSIHNRRMAPTVTQEQMSNPGGLGEELTEGDRILAYLAINVLAFMVITVALSPLGSGVALIGGAIISAPISIKAYRKVKGEPGTEFEEGRQEVKNALEEME